MVALVSIVLFNLTGDNTQAASNSFGHGRNTEYVAPIPLQLLSTCYFSGNMASLPSMMGKVSLHYDPKKSATRFTAKHEAELDNHDQLPQFLPRLDWPSIPGLGESRTSQRLRTDTIDWDDDDAVQVLHNEAAAAYPNLSRMPPFEDGVYDDTPWLTHVAFMHSILCRTIAKTEPLDNLEMYALLRTISYGMHHTMTFFKPWYVAGPSTGARTRQSEPEAQRRYVSEFGILMHDGNFQEDGRVQYFYRDRIAGRRWLVAPIRQNASHWAMSIFDRQKGHLYIFDCDEPHHREIRVEACLHLWVRFWNWLDMPSSFQYFVPGVTELSGLRDSGLAAVMWVMLNLRNQVGRHMDPEDSTIVRRDFLILPPNPRFLVEQSSLPLHDWVPDGCSNAQQGMQGIEHILRVLVCNELGLHNNPHMKKPFGDQRLVPMNLLNKAKTYMTNGSGFPSSEFWTGNGGPQFCLPLRSTILPYPGRGSRSHHKPANSGNVRYQVERLHRDMIKRNWAAQPLVWPDLMGYTHDRPLRRPQHDVRLQVKSITERDEKAQEKERHIRIRMVNCWKDPTYQDIEHPLDVVILGPDVVRQSNGEAVMRFFIEARVGGDRAEMLPFHIPFPSRDNNNGVSNANSASNASRAGNGNARARNASSAGNPR